jgi:type I restriction enzyme S subunit
MKGWKEYKIDEICKVGRGSSPRPIDNPIYFEGGDIPWVKIADATASGKKIYQTKEYINDYGASFSRHLPAGSLILATSGVSLGQTKFLGVDACIHDGWLYFDEFNDKIDKEYFYHRLLLLTDYLHGQSYGAAIQNVNTGILRSIKLLLPPLPTQRKIASILSAYDDLIENNLKRIKLLEETAQRTYEEWFVKFRINGKQLKINKETGLPEGWEEKELGKIITKLESGSRPKGGIDKELKNGIPSVGAESVLGLGQYNYGKEKLILESFYKKMNRGKVEQKDILVYKDGAYIGKTSMFQDEFPHKICVVNEHVFLINTGDEDYQNYLFFTLNRPEYFQKMQSLNSNSAQPGINQEKLNSLIILVPKKEIIKKYSEIINPSVKEIFNLAKQNHLLRESRDILLPKLMSGVIEVG